MSAIQYTGVESNVCFVFSLRSSTFRTTSYRAPCCKTPGYIANAATYAAPASCPFSPASTPTTDSAHTSSPTSAAASCSCPCRAFTGPSLPQTPTTIPLLSRSATYCCQV